MQANQNTIESFRITLSSRWGGGPVHDRDRAWLEFVPRGGSAPQENMFTAATELDLSDSDVAAKAQMRIANDWRSAAYEGIDLSEFVAYYVYKTTCG